MILYKKVKKIILLIINDFLNDELTVLIIS